ncbi:MAG: NAD-dependent epimerase/dehydratase family protein, partial [Flammeovirgaceae bacterium]
MIAVTGATGLLGSFVVRQLLHLGHTVMALCHRENLCDMQHSQLFWKAVDVQDNVALQDALAGAEAVVHTAALVSFNPQKRNEIFSVNVTGTKNVVDSCLSLNIRKLIHISSVAALGRKKAKEVEVL